MKKKLTSWLLVLVLIFGLIPAAVLSAEAAGERGQWSLTSLKGAEAGEPYKGYSSIADLNKKYQNKQALSRYTFKDMECTTYATARAEEKMFGTRTAPAGGLYAKDLPKEIYRGPLSNGKISYNIEVYVADGKTPESSKGKYIVSNSYACFDSSSKFSNVYAGHVIFIEEVAVYEGVKYVYYTEGGRGFSSWEVKRETFDSFWNDGKGYTGSVLFIEDGKSVADTISSNDKAPATFTIADGWYTLAPKCAPKTRLDVKDASKNDKANVQIYTANNTDAQQFYFSSVGNGYYTIKAKHSGKMVDVYNADTASGTNVHQYSNNGTDAQKWRIYDEGNGYVSLAPKVNTSLRLDVSGGKSADGTNVQVYTSNNTDAQKWKLVNSCLNGHTRGQFLSYSSDHPHYPRYSCAICGTIFLDSSVNSQYNMPNCKTCNPSPTKIIVSRVSENITANSATIDAHIESSGQPFTIVCFFFGEDPNHLKYTWDTEHFDTATSAWDVHINLDSSLLQPDTTYYYRYRITRINSILAESEVRSFKTPALPASKPDLTSQPIASPQKSAPSTLAVAVSRAPSQKINQGTAFTVQGYISSNYDIIRASSSIYDSRGTEIQSFSIAPNTDYINIAASNLVALDFSKLELGQYSVIFTATDSSGTTRSWTGNFEVVMVPSTLAVAVSRAPNQEMNQGTAFTVYGYISSNYKISYAEAAIYNSQGSAVQSTYTTSDDTYVNIAASKLAALDFSTLTPGRYTLVVSATDSSDTTRSWTSTTFEVVAAASSPAGFQNFTDKYTYRAGLFTDVPAGSWYANNVARVYALGLMNGLSKDYFGPSNNITIAEAVALAARIHKIYQTGSDQFPSYDGGHWYDPYVDYAKENGIIYENYNLERTATREIFVHILAASLPDNVFPTSHKITLEDASDIIYANDIDKFVRAGIITGVQYSDGVYFLPGNAITRSEVAALVQRMVDR